MIVRLNMQGYFTKDLNLDAPPRVGEGVDYVDTHENKVRHLQGVVNHIRHFIDHGQQVVAVSCSAREVE